MTPHVFVTCGDLTRLACDAWLVPTDESLFVGTAWRGAAGHPGAAPVGWSGTGLRAFAEAGKATDTRLRVWTDVGADRGEGVDWFVEAARQFVHVAADALKAGAAEPGTPGAPRGRARPLVALPVVGSGFGGGADKTGEIVAAISASWRWIVTISPVRSTGTISTHQVAP